MLAAFVEVFDPQHPVSALRVADRPDPATPPGWTVIEVKAASINHHDIWSLRGVGLDAGKLPMVLGCDAAGIDANGREVIVHAVVTDPVDSAAPGRPSVLSERHQGTFAQFLAVPAANLVPKPASLSFAEAACLPTAWLTAYNMLFRQASLSPGDTVLVQGASGGLSTALLALGNAAGFRMWATGRSEDKRSHALALGAQSAFEPGQRLPARVDAVMESVGAATWEHSLKALRPEGTVVVAGATSGYMAQTELGRIFANRLKIVGTAMGSLADLRRLVSFCDVKGIKPHVHSVEPLTNAVRAFQTVLDGDVRGKVVLQP
ncbi:zinc-binding dehydrogenase [Nocardioides endophyticus]|uniref:Zinc-binding dehydrogenase n=1 Tax=Nocardioides endophyticus TaxID=1353775 RepID=A0ABP8YK39_9ACTN